MALPTDTFAQRLRSLQKIADLNASELARRVRVSTTCVHNWREGNTFPGPHNLAALARELSVTEDYLRDGTTEDRDLPEFASPSEMIPLMVERLKARIAEATGLEVSRVKLSLEIT
jgi:transcriptional regulator with XRE-family HTH domain